jgi:hypothetical protein
MFIPIDRKYNLFSLSLVAPLIKDMDYFLFFGSLLGYHREGNLLAKDDDLDIFINQKHTKEVILILKKIGFKIRVLNPSFIQGTTRVGKTQIYVDFFMYQVEKENVIDRWNFSMGIGSAMHVPCDILFPTQDASIGSLHFKVPHDPEACCRFVYGENYMKPMRKVSEYRMSIVNHKPVVCKI